MRDALPEQLAIELKAHADDVPALLGAEQIARAAEFEVAHRDAETGAELVVLPDRTESLARDIEELRVPVQKQVGVGLMLETPDASAELI